MDAGLGCRHGKCNSLRTCVSETFRTLKTSTMQMQLISQTQAVGKIQSFCTTPNSSIRHRTACRSAHACKSRSSRCDDAEPSSTSRRSMLLQSAALAAGVALGTDLRPAQAAEAAGPPKATGLTADQMLQRIKEDFQKRQYYVTGDLSPELFTDDCLFTDPTIKVNGWEFYTNAVRTLFDADQSRADIRDIRVVDDRTISLDWRLEGRIKPWFNAAIKPYDGTTVYKLDDDGLIYQHLETWVAPAYDVFLSVFFPNFGVPPSPPVALPRS